jgi:hypothetical protein
MLAEILAKGKNIQPSSTTQDDKGLDCQSYQFSHSRISWRNKLLGMTITALRPLRLASATSVKIAVSGLRYFFGLHQGQLY